MKKFTVIAEYKGGTYVSQHYADTVDEAVMKWAENLDLQYFSEKEKRKIMKLTSLDRLQYTCVES